MSSTVVRYSDAELEEFKQLILDKLTKAKEQLASLQEQILDITENTSDEHGGDWVDDSSINNEVEMLNNMAIRQRMYIKDLENALVRIKNKSYGICSITGQLIDKKRLLAVPTTTKSLEAKAVEQTKNVEQVEAPKPVVPPKPPTPAPTERKVITKVIRKPTNSTNKAAVKEDDDDDLDFERDFFYDEEDDSMTRSMGDLDDFPEETTSNDDVDF
ncbi:MAG: TraR/DksA family transcriptional regulator [Saprospiraceae bacterium]